MKAFEIVFGVLLVILFLAIVMRPVLQRWIGNAVQRWILGKVEDRMRRMAGMPTRKEEKKARKRERQRDREGAFRFRRAAEGKRRRSPRSTVSLLRVVAEDVEFVEIKDYSSHVEIGVEQKSTTYIIEEQIEDAEFKEIK